MMKLYDYPPSGNGYKVRLILAYLNIPYHYLPLDILADDARTPAFLAMNANGKIPIADYRLPILPCMHTPMLPEKEALTCNDSQR